MREDRRDYLEKLSKKVGFLWAVLAFKLWGLIVSITRSYKKEKVVTGFERKEVFIRAFTIAALFMVYIIFLLTFLTAYFSDSKTVTITINHYNEALLELFIFVVLVPFFAYGSFMLVKDIWKKREF